MLNTWWSLVVREVKALDLIPLTIEAVVVVVRVVFYLRQVLL
jgi:hypothetical protein